METPDEHDLLDAFADGELDETQHADAAERFRDDAECRRYASSVSRLRGSLAAMWSAESAPAPVRERLSEVLTQTGSPALTTESPNCVSEPLDSKAWRTTWSPRRVSMFAMAATIVLVTLIWQLWPQQRPPTVQVTRVSPRTLLTVTNLHTKALAAGGVLGEDRLIATTEAEARRILSQALEIPVLAPDLSGQGFAFLGATQCVIGRLPAAHLLYRRDQGGVLLSLFSVRKLEMLRSHVMAAGVLEVFEAETKSVTSLAWHSGPATYMACASLPSVQLRSVLGLSPLSATQSRRFGPVSNDARALATSEVSEYDALRRASTTAAPEQREPANVVSQRRPPSEAARHLEWIAIVQRAIVMGCS